MKMKNVLRIGALILIICIALSTVVSAAYDYSSSITSLESATGDTTLNGKANTIVGSIIAVLRIIAVGVAIIMLIVLAMKYMMSAPSDRAEIKKHAVVYIVGAVVLFAASGILTIIQSFAGNIS